MSLLKTSGGQTCGWSDSCTFSDWLPDVQPPGLEQVTSHPSAAELLLASCSLLQGRVHGINLRGTGETASTGTDLT